jgi:hypothetical protein
VATRTDNTFAEALEKLTQQVAQLKLLPDCDDELVDAIQEAIIGWYRQPIENSMAQGTTSVQSSPADAMGMPPGMPPGMPGMPPGMGGVGASQIAAGGAMGRGMPAGVMSMGPPNPDELRRQMQSPTGMR